jgi:hypothetical protein
MASIGDVRAALEADIAASDQRRTIIMEYLPLTSELSPGRRILESLLSILVASSRDIRIPDVHIDTLKVTARNFR